MRALLWRLPFSKAEPHGTILKSLQRWQENHFYLQRGKETTFLQDFDPVSDKTAVSEHSHSSLVGGTSVPIPRAWLALNTQL